MASVKARLLQVLADPEARLALSLAVTLAVILLDPTGSNPKAEELVID